MKKREKNKAKFTFLLYTCDIYIYVYCYIRAKFDIVVIFTVKHLYFVSVQ